MLYLKLAQAPLAAVENFYAFVKGFWDAEGWKQNPNDFRVSNTSEDTIDFIFSELASRDHYPRVRMYIRGPAIFTVRGVMRVYPRIPIYHLTLFIEDAKRLWAEVRTHFTGYMGNSTAST